MRQNKFIATKDHFIMLAASNEVGDALWSGHVEFRRQDGSFDTRTSNTIAFLVHGSVNTFINSSNTVEDWNFYSGATSPVGMIRNNFSDFGIVATSNSVVFGGIFSKESIFEGHTEYTLGGNIGVAEKEAIESSNQTVYVQKKCKVYNKRDVNTFAGIEQEPLNIDVISDSEIQVEVEEQ
jgi:hypothetical protein